MKDAKQDKPLKVGIAVLIGRSNVGKSTLLNNLIGTKVAIITHKPQTTRNVIHGVLNEPRGQVVFVDTPGIFTQVPDTLTAKLNEKAKSSLEGIDVIVYVVDPTRHVGDEEKVVRRLISASEAPKILAINKTDLKAPFKDEYLTWAEGFDRVIEISAINNGNLNRLKDEIFSLLPESDQLLYPLDQMTNVDNRFWLSEVIREKIFLAIHDEVPYSVNVEIEETEKRDNNVWYVAANVITHSDRYKRMIIGAGGRQIKEIGQAARKELEAVTGDKVYLDLNVTVDEKWQERFE
jgi:GTP-binding protein Era